MIKSIFKSVCGLGLVFLILSCVTEAPKNQIVDIDDIHPVSKNGSIIENISSSEIMVEAYGVYNGKGSSSNAKKNDVDKNGVDLALIDARKTALYTVLFMGSNPLIKTEEEKSLFNKNANYIYSNHVLNSFITYEDTLFKSVVKTNEGKGIRVSKNFRINTDLLVNELVKRRVIQSLEEILASAGNPIIMVIPDAPKGQNPIDLLLNDPEKRQVATVIQSYLTSKGYEVIVPEQKNILDDIATTTLLVQGAQRDYAYELALSIGSDIYISFTGVLEDASFGTSRYSLALNAFESTTARLLGAETGYSQERKQDTNVSIEEAVNASINTVLSRVTAYWKEDQKKGIQYKILVTLPPYLDSYQLDDIHLGFLDSVDVVALSSRELVLTPETIEYLLWVDPNKYDRGLRLYNGLREEFRRNQGSGELGRISINRKFIHLQIED